MRVVHALPRCGVFGFCQVAGWLAVPRIVDNNLSSLVNTSFLKQTNKQLAPAYGEADAPM